MPVDPDALAKLIRDSGVEVRENATSFIFTCPRCQKKGKLAMYRNSGGFICYHCASSGFKGRAEIALTELLGMPIVDIRKRLYGTATPPLFEPLHIELRDFWGEDEDEIFAPQNAVMAPGEVMWPVDVAKLGEPNFAKGEAYLANRGIGKDLIKAYDIRFSPLEQRVLFPVKVDGKLIGWQGRYIGPTKQWIEEQQRFRIVPKIVTSDSLRGAGKRWLMFQDRLKGSEHCILTEGPISAIKAHKCGGNVATMGKDVTSEQLAHIIASGVKKLYIALDPDAGAKIMEIAHTLSNDLEIYLMAPKQNLLNFDDPDNDEDLGDMSLDEVAKVFEEAKPEPWGKLYVSVGGILAH